MIYPCIYYTIVQVTNEYNESSTSTISATTSSRGSVECRIKIGDFVVVKIFSAEGKHKNFIKKICNGPDKDGDYEVNFLKLPEKIKHGFSFLKKSKLHLLY